ncbi:MAG: polyketide cyclase [Gammaproteobacteria bacterium]|nr:MAG: polyketide cyclase [Gammaproteobacteria bacterium]
MKKSGPRVVGTWPDQAHHTPEQREKARIVLEFYQRFVIEHDPSVGPKFFGKSYTQHNPMVADGREGLRLFAETLRERFPDLEVEIKRVLVDGDFVILHVYSSINVCQTGTRGMAVMDIFRLEGDRIVEHWDVMQEIPETAANGNTMF